MRSGRSSTPITRWPGDQHGYCTDDMARVLIAVAREPQPDRQVLELGRLAFRFLADAQGVTGRDAQPSFGGRSVGRPAKCGGLLGPQRLGVRHGRSLRARALDARKRTRVLRTRHRHPLDVAAGDGVCRAGRGGGAGRRAHALRSSQGPGRCGDHHRLVERRGRMAVAGGAALATPTRCCPKPSSSPVCTSGDLTSWLMVSSCCSGCSSARP